MRRSMIARRLSEAVETVIVKGTDRVPFVRPDVAEIVKRINLLSNYTLDLRHPGQFYDPRLLVDVLDTAAREYTRNAQVIATGSGGATGSLGLPGLALDLPVLVAITVGLVRRHALVYGFSDIEEAGGDRVPLLIAFGTALGAESAINRVTSRMAAAATGETMQRVLTRVISEEMASRMVTRWLPRAVPVLSTATSAALDFLFLREAGKRSMQHYRSRHLLVRRQIDAAHLLEAHASSQSGTSTPGEGSTGPG